MDQLKKQKELEEYKALIASKNLEEVLEIEKEIIKEADDLNERIQKYEFKLSNKGYKEAAEAIRYFLNTQSVTWQYTVGMITMYEFWNPSKNPKTVLYPMFDGTLRTLGELKFTGYTEWKYVVAINEYFKDVRDEYANITEEIWDNASKHSIICDRIQLLDPQSANKNGTAPIELKEG